MKIKLYGKALVTLGVAAALSACGSDTPDDGDGNTGDTGSVLYNITSQVTGPGALSPSTHQMDSTETLSMQVTADENAELQSISGCNGSLNTSQSQYTISGLSADCSVQAVFTATDTGSVGSGTSITVGRSHMTFAAFTVDDDVSPLDIPISGTNTDGQSGSFEADFSGLSDDTWVLIKASGGMQLDPQYTGEYHTGYNTPDAELFALAQVRDWKSGANISALSDIAWRLVQPYIGALPFEEAILRLNEVTASLSYSDEWSYRDLLNWTMQDRTTLGEDSTVSFRSTQISTDGSVILGSESEGGYLYYVDNDFPLTTLGEMAANIAGPSIRYGAPGTGTHVSRVTLRVAGPGKIESEIDAFNYDFTTDEQMPVAFVERSLKRNKITAVDSEADNIRFVGWRGCPNVVDVYNCEFSGLNSLDIVAEFDAIENKYVDGYVEIDSSAYMERIDENTVLFVRSSLSLEDIQKLSELNAGGYIGYFDFDDGVFAKVLSAVENSDGDFTVTTEIVPWEEILLEGTIRAVAGPTIYEFEDETGQAFQAKAGDTFSLHGYQVHITDDGEIQYASASSERESFNTPHADYDFGLRMNIDSRETSLRHMDNFAFTNIDIIYNYTLSFEAKVALRPTIQRKMDLWAPKGIIRPVVLLGIPFTFEAKPKVTAKIHSNIDGMLGTWYTHERSFRSGFTASIRPIGTKVTPVGSTSVLSAPDPEFDVDLLSEGVEFNAGSEIVLAGDLTIGVLGGQVLFAEAKAGLEAEVEFDLEKAFHSCDPVDVYAGLYGELTGGVMFEILGATALGKSTSYGRILNAITGDRIPLAVARSPYPFPTTHIKEYINNKVGAGCAQEGMTVVRNMPEDLIYTFTYHPQHELFRTYYKNSDGTWVTEPRLRNSSHDPDAPSIIVRNSNEEENIPISLKVEAGHHPDGFNQDMEQAIQILIGSYLGDLPSQGGSPWSFEPGQEDTVRLNVWGFTLPDVHTVQDYRHKKLEYLLTFTNETPGSEEIEEVSFTVMYEEPPQLDPINFYMARSRVDMGWLLVELSQPDSIVTNQSRYWNFLQYLDVTVSRKGSTSSDNFMTTLTWMDDRPFIYVQLGADNNNPDPSLPIQIKLKHGFAGAGHGEVVHDYTVTLPPCLEIEFPPNQKWREEEGERNWDCDTPYEDYRLQ